MIKVPTVLVVGAGGSIPYGFPSGFGLKQEFNSNNFRAAMKLTFGSRDANDFLDTLLTSGAPSVDAFLGRRPEFTEIGKFAIAAALLPKESRAPSYARQHLGMEWYEYLWQMLDAPFDDFLKSKLTIITFNYDRSLDYFIQQSIHSNFKKSELETTLLCASVPMIHVHGKLGDFTDVPYGGQPDDVGSVSKEMVLCAAKGIKVIHEAVDDSPEFSAARQALAAAQRVYYVGFSYDERSMERLGTPSQAAVNGEVRGCRFGMTGPELIKTRRFFHTGHQLQFGDETQDALQFLRNSWPLNM